MSPWERGAYGRTVTLDQEVAIADAFRSGTRAKVLAKQYGLNVRTIYRAIHRAERHAMWVTVGDYWAPFAYGDEGPIQLGTWVPKPSEAVA